MLEVVVVVEATVDVNLNNEDEVGERYHSI